jgi:WD40 repeat protein
MMGARQSTLFLCLMLCVHTFVHAQRPELIIQTGPANDVNTVAYSPDGKTLASAGWDSFIKLWDIETGTEIRSLIGHPGVSIHSLSFSPDGKTLASGAHDKTNKLWDVATGAELMTLKWEDTGKFPAVDAVKFNPDGKSLVSGSWDKVTKLWNTKTGKELKTFTNSFARSAAFSPDGEILALGFDDFSIKLWNIATKTELRTLRGHSAMVLSIAFSPNGKSLISIGDDKMSRLWDAETGKELRTIKWPSPTDGYFWFGQIGKVMASGQSRVDSMGFKYWANNSVRLWNMETGKELSEVKCRSYILPITFSPDDKTLVGSCDDRKNITLWDVATGAELRTFTSNSIKLRAVEFSKNGKSLAISEANDTINLWDTESGRGLRITPTIPKELPAGNGVNTHIPTLVARILQVPGENFEFSPDGRIFARGGNWDSTIRLWDVTRGKELRTFTGHRCDITALSFSADGAKLASGSCDKTIKLWDVATGNLLLTLEGHTAEITSVSFSQDGLLLASGSGTDDKTIKVWDVVTGKAVRTITGEPFYVASVSFGKDKNIVASVGYSSGSLVLDGKMVGPVGYKTFNLWDINSGKLLETARLDATDTLTKVSNDFPRFYGVYGAALSDKFTAIAENVAIKLHDRKTDKELATLINLNDKDWIVVTAEGLFDGSPAAWKQIIWRFNNNTFDYAPAEAFFKEFYYPGLLQELGAGEQPKPPTKELSEIDIRQPQLRFTEVNKHVLEQQAFGKSAVLTNPSNERIVTLTVQVTDNINLPRQGSKFGAIGSNVSTSGARDLRLFRNGSLVKLWQGDVFNERSGCEQLPTSKDMPRRAICKASLRIVAGDNEFTAYVFNHENVKSRDVSVIIQGDNSLRRPNKLYVLIIGVNQYANTQYNLRYAVSDAQNFALEVKRKQELVKPDQKVEVIPLLNAEATKANILKTLIELTRRVQPDDGVIVYFSGHGAANGNSFYLIPHDIGYQGRRDMLDAMSLRAILKHSISDKELEDAFEKIDAGRILLVIDACNSGQALDSEEKRRGPMNSKGLAQLAYEKGMYVLTASQSIELAYESEALKHSYMTYALIEEGLKTRVKETDANGDGQVWLKEWVDFAVKRVPRMRDERIEQNASRRNKSLDLVEVTEPGKVQRPRVFYRREPDTQPWVIAMAK